MFFEMLLYSASQESPCSLEMSNEWLRMEHNIKIKKQSLNERFDATAVVFVKEVIRRVLEKQINEAIDNRFLPAFARVLIKDGTRMVLPSNLSEYYKGYGGSKGTSKAGLCIQYEYDAKNGKIVDLTITHATRNDAKDATETASKVCAGDLVIRDLGYYSLPTLQIFSSAKAFYVSKLGSKTNLYKLGSKTAISFIDLYNDMKKKGQTRLELSVEAGNDRMPVRFIAVMVSEETYKERLRRNDKDNKERGCTTSDDYRARCRFNIFITNTTADMLSIDDVIVLYRLRWQVEIMFKCWKSVLKIDKLQKMKFERFTCMLVAKLILVVLNQQIIWGLNKHFWKTAKKVLSTFKCYRTLMKSFTVLCKVLRNSKKISLKSLKELKTKLSEDHWKDKRKKNINYEDILELFTCSLDN